MIAGKLAGKQFKGKFLMLLGHANKDELILHMEGKATYDEIWDDFFSAMIHIAEVSHEQGMEKQVIYDHLVQAFSLVMDTFHPEGKESKYGDYSDEDILDLINKDVRNK